ncbi:MAG: hypothetical protein PHX08_09700, partial [Lachnospiraceae bacterium]|nr:hypothetical protein [Lachnospiraceae bacterium]
MRTRLILKNMMAASAGQLLSMLMSFIARAVFVRTLSIEYLGIGGLFGNVLAILSLTEMGMGTAVLFSLYAPITSGDTENIKSIIRMFRNAYRIIGCVSFCLGALLTPLIPYFSKETIEIPYLTVIYLLFVFQSSISYFLTYKQVLIVACEERYIVDIYHNLFKIVQMVLTVILLVITHNYLVYLIALIMIGIIENLAIQRKADRMFPYLRDRRVIPLKRDEKREIKRGTLALSVHKGSTVVVKGTDSLLLSKLVGMTAVGIYANYSMISSAVQGMMTALFASMAASIGNIGVVEERQKQENLFEILTLFEFWIVSFCSVCLLCLWNPFIRLWVGEQYLFDDWTVLTLSLLLYVSGRRQVVLMYRDALGLYQYDYIKAIAEAIVNLVVSIILAQRYGTLGVFLGTILSSILICLPIEANIVYKQGFHQKSGKFYLKYIIEFIFFTFMMLITWKLTRLVPQNNILSFGAKMVICVVIPNLLLWLG